MPLAELPLVITGGTAVTVSANDALAVPLLLVAVIVALKVPVAEGVPEISPVAVFTASPGGNPEAPKLRGELVAVI
jgi:hypothetical protein